MPTQPRRVAREDLCARELCDAAIEAVLAEEIQEICAETHQKMQQEKDEENSRKITKLRSRHFFKRCVCLQ